MSTASLVLSSRGKYTVPVISLYVNDIATLFATLKSPMTLSTALNPGVDNGTCPLMRTSLSSPSLLYQMLNCHRDVGVIVRALVIRTPTTSCTSQEFTRSQLRRPLIQSQRGATKVHPK